MTPLQVFDNWSAYLRGVDREDFLKQLELIAVSASAAPTDEEVRLAKTAMLIRPSVAADLAAVILRLARTERGET